MSSTLKKVIQHYLSIASLLVLIPSAAVAQTDADSLDYLTEEDLLGDIPVISGTAHFPQKISHAPTAVTIIDRKMIDASGAIEVTELFRLVPGFQSYNPSGSFPTTNYHALPHHFPGNLEVKVDGRSVYESFQNTVVWATLGIEIEDIDYIEVVRGPNAPADGANAFNGSINIITKSPLTDQGTSLRATAGDLNTRNISLKHSGSGGNFSYRLSGGYRANDGFPDLDENTPDYNEHEIHDELKSTSLGFRGVWTPTLLDTIDLQLGLSNGDIGMGEGGSNQDPEEILPWEMSYNYQYLNWERQLNTDQKFQLLFYHNDLGMDVSQNTGYMYSDFVGPVDNDYEIYIGIDDGYSERYDLELRHSGNITKHSRFSWGAAARYDEAQSELFFTQSDPVSENSQRIFGNLETAVLEQLTFNAGVIFEHTDSIGTHSSYRVSANYHMNRQNTFRIAYSDGTRAPTLLQANEYRSLTIEGITYFVDRVASDNLKEEELISKEIGYYGHFYQGNFTIDIKLFDDQSRDIIDDIKDQEQDINLRANAMDIDSTGVEVQVNYTPGEAWLLTAQVSQQNTDGESTRKINPTKIRDMDGKTPKRTGNVLVAYSFLDGYTSSLNYFYLGEVNWFNGGNTASFERWDFMLAKRFKISQTQTKIEFMVRNLLDEEYQDFQNHNNFERRYFVSLTMDF